MGIKKNLIVSTLGEIKEKTVGRAKKKMGYDGWQR